MLSVGESGAPLLSIVSVGTWKPWIWHTFWCWISWWKLRIEIKHLEPSVEQLKWCSRVPQGSLCNFNLFQHCVSARITLVLTVYIRHLSLCNLKRTCRRQPTKKSHIDSSRAVWWPWESRDSTLNIYTHATTMSATLLDDRGRWKPSPRCD